MRDLNSAIEAAKGSGDGAPALPGSAVCAPPRSEFWPRPRETPALGSFSVNWLPRAGCPLSPHVFPREVGPRQPGREGVLFW